MSSFDIGSWDWFRKRAIEKISKVSEDLWDYSDSALVYTPAAAEEWMHIQRDTTGLYKQRVADASTKIVEFAAPKIIQELPSDVAYIDLGPGAENKQELFIEPMFARGVKVQYIPVDINQQMLEVASDFTRGKTKVEPILAEFDEIATVIESREIGYRFVSLGPTYMNYDPKEAISILEKICKGGSAFVSAQLRERIRMEEVIESYRQMTGTILKSKIELLGFNFDQDVMRSEADDKIFVYILVKNIPIQLAHLGMKKGDRILVHKSYRPTLEEFKNSFNGLRPVIFDSGEDFVGAQIFFS